MSGPVKGGKPRQGYSPMLGRSVLGDPRDRENVSKAVTREDIAGSLAIDSQGRLTINTDTNGPLKTTPQGTLTLAFGAGLNVVNGSPAALVALGSDSVIVNAQGIHARPRATQVRDDSGVGAGTLADTLKNRVELVERKDVAGGYPGLDSRGKILPAHGASASSVATLDSNVQVPGDQLGGATFLGAGANVLIDTTPPTFGPVPAAALPAHHTTHETGGTDAITALAATVLTSGLVPAARIQEVIALADLTDVTGTTGSGTVAVLQTSPHLITPDIGTPSTGVLTNCTDLQVAGGGTGGTSSVTGLDNLTIQSVNIASASVTDLTTATGRRVLISGSATINSFGTTSVGKMERLLYFNGSPTIVHGSSTIICPNSTNISVSVGSTALVRSEGSNVWRIYAYMDGMSLPPTGTNTGDQTITLTGGVTGGGTGSFAATVVTNANLTGEVTSVGNAATLAYLKVVRITSNVTTTSGTAADVTGLSFAIAASEVWAFEIHLMTMCSTVNGHKWALDIPTSCAVAASLRGSRATAASIISDDILADDTLSTTVGTGTYTTGGWVDIIGIVTNSTNAGTVQVRFAANTAGDTITAKAQSFILARRIS